MNLKVSRNKKETNSGLHKVGELVGVDPKALKKYNRLQEFIKEIEEAISEKEREKTERLIKKLDELLTSKRFEAFLSKIENKDDTEYVRKTVNAQLKMLKIRCKI